MATQPVVFPQFAVSDLNNGTAGAPNVVEPSAGKKLTGWNEGERPPRETFNWLHRITNDWIEWFDQELGTGGGPNFAQDTATTVGLNFGFDAGQVVVDGSRTAVAAGTILLLANFVQFVGYNIQTSMMVSGISQFQDPDIIPLYRVTTGPGTITLVEDQRTPFQVVDPAQAERLDQHQMATAGVASELVDLPSFDTTPTPDCALGNTFLYSPSNAVNTMQPPINSEALAGTQTQNIVLIIENGAGETTSFASTDFQLLNSQQSEDGLATILGEGTFRVTLTYLDGNNRWYGTIEGPGYNVVGANLRKVKLTTEIKNTAGVTDDDTLTGFILPPGLYKMTGFLHTGFSPGNGGIDMNWQENSGTFGTDGIWVTGFRTTNTSPFDTEGGVFFITNGVDLTLPDNGINDTVYIKMDGVVEVTATANIDFQWAPVNAVNLALSAGSYIEFERIG